MIRLRVVFMVEEDKVGTWVNDLLGDGAIAVEIDYDSEEP